MITQYEEFLTESELSPGCKLQKLHARMTELREPYLRAWETLDLVTRELAIIEGKLMTSSACDNAGSLSERARLLFVCTKAKAEVEATAGAYERQRGIYNQAVYRYQELVGMANSGKDLYGRPLLAAALDRMVDEIETLIGVKQ